MNYFFSITLAAIVLHGLCSCEASFQEKLKLEATNNNIEIAISEEDSKALLDLEDGKTLTWESGDKIGLFHYVNGVASQLSCNVPYTYDASSKTFKAEDGKAVWSGNGNDNHAIYVYYPWREDAKSPSAEELIVQHTSKQTYNATADTWRLDAKYGFAYSCKTSVEFNKKVQLDPLKQYLAILRLNITNNSSQSVNIKSVEISNSDKSIRGSYKISLLKNASDGYPSHTFSDGVKTITTTISNGHLTAGKSADIRIVVRPIDYSKTTFTVKLTYDDNVVEIYTFEGGILEKGGRAFKNISVEDVTEAEERYSPSKKTTYYRPIKIDLSVDNTTAENRVWHTVKARTVKNIVGFTADETLGTYKSKTNRFGSSTELPRQTATGRFYTKNIDGRWWIVDPEGCLHYVRGVNTVRPGTSSNNLDRFYKRFSNIPMWLEQTHEELSTIGFYCSGAFSKDYYNDFLSYNASNPDSPFILAPSLSFLKDFKDKYVKKWPGNLSTNKVGLVLHEHWSEWCKEEVRETAKNYKNDPNTLGIFSDNEIEFTKALPLLLKISSSEYAYKATKQWCIDHGIDYTDSEQTNLWDNRREFGVYLAEKYYKAVYEAIKEFDPQMLYLGTRLHGETRTSASLLKAIGKYCDILSVNYYGDWNADLAKDGGERRPGKQAEGTISNWATWTGKPFLVTEFYTKGIEDSELNNQSGAGFAVRNQVARSYAYQHFTLGLLEAPGCIGWNWFKYQDDEPEDNDNMGANKGIFDRNFEMFPHLGKYMQELNIHVYELINFFDNQ